MRASILTTKIIIAGAAVLLIGWLFYKNLVPSGRFEVVYNFKPSPFISALRPPERLSEFPNLRARSPIGWASGPVRKQEITGDPVYFDLHLPSSFERVELDILHKYKEGQKFTIAAFTDRKNWKFITADTQLRNPYRDYADGLALRANFSTAGLDIVDRTITFILGAPEASIDNPIIIYEIRAVATKPPIRLLEIPAKILRVFRFQVLNS